MFTNRAWRTSPELEHTPDTMNFSPIRIMWNDWPALASWVAMPITWAIHFGFPYLYGGAAALPLVLPVGVSVALVAVLLWRIKRVADLFARGAVVSGTVTDLMIAKDRGRLVFEFDAPGTRVRTWMPIHKTRDVLSLTRGDRVDVLYDAKQPRRAIVKCLFVA